MYIRRACEISAAAVLFVTGLAFVAVAQQPASKPWVPGGSEMMPQDMLMKYPCHDDEMPCFNIPAPAIEKVTFKGPLNGDKERGKTIAINIRWGNCIACHSLPEGQAGGNVGPDLSQRGAFPVDLQEMYQRIWDVRAYNKDAHMPIYGANKVLGDQEIRDVMTYVLSGK